jgi:transposase
MPGKKITPVQKAYANLLRVKHNASYRDIAKECKISKSSSHRICSMPINEQNTKVCKKKGRPRKLNSRNVRSLIRTLKVLRLREPNVSVKSLVVETGLSLDAVSRRTVSRILNENGYGFLQRRKKGILSDRDRVLRRRFCRKVKKFMKQNASFWTNEVSFYMDGVSFIHKFNPMRTATTTGMARVWRKKGEGLILTGKGSKDLPGGCYCSWKRCYSCKTIRENEREILC